MSLLVSSFTGGHPEPVVIHVEVTMYMQQVHKNYTSQHTHLSVNTAQVKQRASGGEQVGGLATPNQSLTDYC